MGFWDHVGFWVHQLTGLVKCVKILTRIACPNFINKQKTSQGNLGVKVGVSLYKIGIGSSLPLNPKFVAPQVQLFVTPYNGTTLNFCNLQP